MVVGGGVFVFPEAGGHGFVVGGFEAGVEGGIDVGHAAEVDGVGEFVDEDVFGGVGVAGVGEEVFFSAGAEGVGFAAAGSAGSGVPEILVAYAGGVLAFSFTEEGEFGEVCGEFVVGDDAEAGATIDEGFAEVVAVSDHLVDEEYGFLEGVGVDGFRGDDGEAVGVFDLGVARGNAFFGWGIEAVALDECFGFDGHFGAGFFADDFELVADGGIDDFEIAGFDDTVGDFVSVGGEPEDFGDFFAAVDELEFRAWGFCG